jgi:hypothetical protein
MTTAGVSMPRDLIEFKSSIPVIPGMCTLNSIHSTSPTTACEVLGSGREGQSREAVSFEQEASGIANWRDIIDDVDRFFPVDHKVRHDFGSWHQS